MAALPGGEWLDAEPLTGAAPLARVTHVFTHFRLELTVVGGSQASGDGWWQPIDSLSRAGLPTLYRRAVEAVLAARSALAA
jgi:A/G-specific adenine glycosylase